MMYRRHAAQQPAKSNARAGANTKVSFADMAADAVLDFLVRAGLYEQAKRENRRRNRQARRSWKSQTYHAGNGARECARRMRQIARGQLTVANGLQVVRA